MIDPASRGRAYALSCALIGWAPVAVSGCDQQTAPEPYVVSDSAGVQVVESREPLWGDTTGWSIASRPSLRIGASAGRAEDELHRVVAVRRLDDGRIVVANAGTDEIRFYGADGTWIRSSGGSGDGPGEFRQISRMAVGTDSIWIWDLAQGRLTVLDGAGRFARAIRLSQSEGGSPVVFAGLLPSGRLLLEEYVSFWRTDPEPGIQPIEIAFRSASRDGTRGEEIGRFEAGVHLVQVREDGAASMAVPFARSSFYATTGRGLVHGTGEDFEVRAFTPSGELTRIIRTTESVDPVGPEDLDEWIGMMTSRSEQPDAAARRLRQRYTDVPLPETKPTYSDVKVGPIDDLWLERFGLPAEPVSEWSVFDSTGVYLGRLELPERFELHQEERTSSSA